MNRNQVLLLLNFEDQEERQRRNRSFYELKLYRKTLRQISDPFLIDQTIFFKHYRMHPNLAWDLVLLLEDRIVNQGPCDIPVDLQVLSTLRFFAEGGFQKGVAQDFMHPTTQPVFSRCLERVCRALCSISHEWIRFPRTREERVATSNRFLQLNRIPGILGLLDCVVMKIVRPRENEEAFFNHRHGHSLNVQVICNADLVINDIKICPGSNNDRFIWKYSDARDYMRSLRHDPQIVGEEGHYYIVADSGYTPSPILLTPIRDAVRGTPNAFYTSDICGTRCRIEITFGHWTNKLKCASRSRVLHYAVPKAAKIILSSAVLHNYIKLNGIRPNIVIIPHLHQHLLPLDEIADYRQGLQVREALVNQLYNYQVLN